MPSGQWTLAELQRQLQLQGVSLLQLTAALFNALAPEDYPSLSGIDQLFVGTDVVSYSQVCNVLTALNCRLVHTYGPTETTTFCITLSADHPDSNCPGLCPLGDRFGTRGFMFWTGVWSLFRRG